MTLISTGRAYTELLLTIVAEKELILYPVDCHGPQVRLAMNELEALVVRVKQPLRIQRLQVDDLESSRASNTHLGLQVMYRG